MRARRAAGGDDDDDDDEDFGGKKIGKKKAAKLEAKEEKRNMREAMEEEKQKRKEREEQREAERAEAEAARKREREEKEEAERKAQEEIKKKEEEEFDKWKDLFETGEDGAQADDDLQESQGMLQEFIDYLKDNKITPLDEVAAKFGLKAQEVLNRVEGLESMGRVTGLMDDRGKFIYISMDEMKGVAKWINNQGRVSVEDLVSESARLVDMQPREKAPVIDFGDEDAVEAA
mmetsp:Transcript_14759/g.35846  ORF Transcript_14759/g.35846 Transcript_14759/m.35846 type:complete len:232 (+) Transcript_14759:1-696(+)